VGVLLSYCYVCFIVLVFWCGVYWCRVWGVAWDSLAHRIGKVRVMDILIGVETEECRTCGEQVKPEDICGHNRDGVAICQGCHEDYWYYCHTCDVSVRHEHYDTYLDICNACVRDNYTACADCGTWCRDGYDIYWNDYDDTPRCESCYCDHERHESIEYVYGYHEGAPWGLNFHTAYHTSEEPAGLTYFGVELEHERASDDLVPYLESLHDKRIAHAESDSSLNNGVELITQPATLMAWRGGFGDLIREYMANARGVGADFSSSTCGAHVHVSRTAFVDDNHLARVAVFMTHNPEHVAKVSGREYLDQWAKATPYRGALRRAVKNNSGDRYRAVNLNNSATVEFRLFAGSNDFADIIGAIEYVSALVEYTRELKVSDITIGALLADSFMAWLNDPTLTGYAHARELVARRCA